MPIHWSWIGCGLFAHKDYCSRRTGTAEFSTGYSKHHYKCALMAWLLGTVMLCVESHKKEEAAPGIQAIKAKTALCTSVVYPSLLSSPLIPHASCGPILCRELCREHIHKSTYAYIPRMSTKRSMSILTKSLICCSADPQKHFARFHAGCVKTLLPFLLSANQIPGA